jgi:hypothetical protein
MQDKSFYSIKSEEQVADYLIGGDEFVYQALVERALELGGMALVKMVKNYETPYKMVPHYNAFEFLEELDPGSKDKIKDRAHQLRKIEQENIKSNFIQSGLVREVEEISELPGD